MNKVVLIGRLAKDVDTRYSQNAEGVLAVSRYTLAVDRKGKDAGADFISCVAFGKQGEFAEKYLHKGMKIAVEGRIQTGNYTDKETGKKVYTTDIVVENHEFCESKQSDNDAPEKENSVNGWLNIPDGVDEDLPFN